MPASPTTADPHRDPSQSNFPESNRPGLRCGATTRAPASRWAAAVRIGRPRSQSRTVPSRRDRLLFTRPDAILVVDAATLRVRRRIPAGASAAGSRRTGASSPSAPRTAASRILDLRTGERGRCQAGTRTGFTDSSSPPTAAPSLTRQRRRQGAGLGRALGRVRETLTGHTGPVPTSRSTTTGARSTPAGWTAGSSSGISPATAAWHARSQVSRSGNPGGCSTTRPRSRSARPARRLPPGSRTAACVCTTRARCAGCATCRGIEGEPVWAVEFSPDGRTIAITGESGAVGAARRGERPRVRPPLPGLGRRRRRWRSRPTAAVSPWRTSRATCGWWISKPATSGGRSCPASRSRVLQPRWRDCWRSGSGSGHRAARRCSLESWPACEPQRRLRSLGPLLARRRLLAISRCGLHAAVGRGQPRADRRTAGGPRGRGVQRGVLARRTDARDERVRWHRDPLGRRVPSCARNAARALRLRVRPLLLRRPPALRLHETGAAERWEVTPGRVVAARVRVAGRDLTRGEWEELVPDQDYRPVCSSYLLDSLARSCVSDTAPRRSASLASRAGGASRRPEPRTCRRGWRGAA